METVTVMNQSARSRRALGNQVKDGLRSVRNQLSLMNLQIGAHADLRSVDLDVFDLLAQHGPQSPSALARLAGLHPATLTGILDRLERRDWIARDRDPADRRSVIVNPQRAGVAKLVGLYQGMTSEMDALLESYTDDELELIAGFLRRTAEAGRTSTEALRELEVDARRSAPGARR
jgi:DNA-binding MarR family transcriptional regulator